MQKIHKLMCCSSVKTSPAMLNSLLRLRDLDFIIRAEPHCSTEETSSEEEVSMDSVWLVETHCLRRMEASSQLWCSLASCRDDEKRPLT